MQELEKILEEIGEMIKRYKENPRLEVVDICYGLNQAKNIIRKHMNDSKCAECSRRKWYQIGYEDGKKDNDGWISVEERLPEDDIDVLITYADIDDENYTDICITTYGYAYLGGNKLDYKEWRSPFEYFKTNYKVIAWRPLPEEYHPERSEE